MGMQVSCLQDNLSRGLNIVSRAVGTRTTLPVLSNVLLSTDNGRLRLAATNLDMGVTVWIGASVEEDGAITVPARTLSDLVNTLSPERVDLEVAVRTNALHLACGATTASIKGIDAQEFPMIPSPTGEDDVLHIPADIFKEAIGLVAFAAARDDSRPILTGVSLSFADGLLTLAAADGFRLSVREIPLDAEFYDSFSLVVPARTLNELARVITEGDEEVLLILPPDRSHVIFHVGDVEITSQLIDGTFPDYRKIIPNEVVTRTVVYTADVLRACRRADIFAREANHTVRFSVEPQDGAAGILRVTAQSSETGENEVVLDASIEGEGLDMAFNVRYLIEVLSVLPDDQVVIKTIKADKPGVLQPVGEESFTHVVMPMHIGR